MRKLGRAVGALALATTLVACTLPPLTTATPTPSPTATPMATPTPSPTPASTSAPGPTPDAAGIPAFTSGQIVATVTPGMRVRQRPGVDSIVVTGLLPVGVELQVVMGPIVTDGFGWYLVADADAAEPTFGEGWIAAGYQPDPFVGPSAREPAADDPHVAGLAATGDAEYGPIPIPHEHHSIRWLALDPQRAACTFSVSLMPPGGQPIPAIRTPIGSGIVPGTLQPSYFVGQPTLRGDLFMTVESDCSWALAVIRVDPEPEPTG